MKILNLNIKLPKPVKDGEKVLQPYEAAIRWIGIMLERAINKPDQRTGRPTVAVNMEVQRKYFKVMDALDKAKDGVAKLEDDDFSFLDKKFHQAEIPIQKDITEILVAIESRINEAKVAKEKRNHDGK